MLSPLEEMGMEVRRCLREMREEREKMLKELREEAGVEIPAEIESKAAVVEELDRMVEAELRSLGIYEQ